MRKKHSDKVISNSALSSQNKQSLRSKFMRRMAAPIYVLIVVGIMVSPMLTPQASAAACSLRREMLGIPTWYKYLKGDNTSGKCLPVLRVDDTVKQGKVSEKNINSALPIGLAVLEIAITLSGIIAFIMVIWGSVKFMLALGEPDKFAGARRTVQNAMIGLVIIIVATRIISFLGGRIAR